MILIKWANLYLVFSEQTSSNNIIFIDARRHNMHHFGKYVVEKNFSTGAQLTEGKVHHHGSSRLVLRPKMKFKDPARVVKNDISKKLHRYISRGISKLRKHDDSLSTVNSLSELPRYMELYSQLPQQIHCKVTISDPILKQEKGQLHRMSTEYVEDVSIVDLLTCPICKKIVQPPSVCCELGHFLCGHCKIQTESCPICGSTAFPNKGNSVFDGILKELRYPCTYQESGCQAFFSHDELEEHQKTCRFASVKCRYASAGCDEICHLYNKQEHEEKCKYGVCCKVFVQARKCNWRGKVEELFDHVTRDHAGGGWLLHQITLQTNVTFTWMLPLTMNFVFIDLIRLDDVDECFYFHMKTESEGNQYLAIQHIGSEERASLYMYTIEFTYGTKTVTYQDNVIPSSAEEVFNNQSCSIFSYEFLKHHFQAERICDCYIRIYRKGHEDPKGKRILSFLGDEVIEQRDGRKSNRESFRDRIKSCLASVEESDHDLDEYDA